MLWAAAILVIVLVTIVYNLSSIKEYIRYRQLLSKLPGPKTYPILGNIPDLLCDGETLIKRIRQWSQEYYPVYRLTVGPCLTANISGPEDFEAIAATSANITKNAFYKFVHLWIGRGILVSTGLKWHKRRKIVNPAFHFKILQEFMETFTSNTTLLVNTLKEVSHKPYVNVATYLSQFTLRTINETAMGVKQNFDTDEFKSYYKATDKIGTIFAYRLTRPWLFVNKIFYSCTRLGYKERQCVEVVHNFTRKVIEEKSKKFENFKMPDVEDDEAFDDFKSKKKLVLLDILLNAKYGSGTIDDEGIFEEVNTFMFAGYDTSSKALSFTLMVLAQHRDVQESLLEEINKVLGDFNAQPTYKDIQELKFLERCVKECLRLYPPAPLIGRMLDADVKTSNGYVLPKGSMVQIHIFDIHRNPKIWPNPDKFDPDRFLPENSENRHPFAYVPFSAGPRNCIGQKFAMLEIKTALCGIIRNFVLEPVDTPENIVIVPNVVITTKKHGMRVKLVPRENK